LFTLLRSATVLSLVLAAFIFGRWEFRLRTA